MAELSFEKNTQKKLILKNRNIKMGSADAFDKLCGGGQMHCRLLVDHAKRKYILNQIKRAHFLSFAHYLTSSRK